MKEKTTTQNSQDNTNNTSNHSNHKSTTILMSASIVILGALAIMILGFGITGIVLLTRNTGPESSIIVDAETSVEVKPDTIVANFVVNQEGANPKVLNDQADGVLADITRYLVDNGLATEDIVTNKSTYPNYQYAPDGRFDDQAELISEVTFEITFNNVQDDLSKPNTIMKGLVEKGVNRFYGYQYQINDREGICQDLESQAISKAYDLAQSRVDSLGGGRITSREVLPIGGDCGESLDFPIYASEGISKERLDQGIDTEAPEISAGTQKVTARSSVKVIYR
jgi:hypothetical protein